MAFPTSGVPSQVTSLVCPDRNGIFYQGDVISLTQTRNSIGEDVVAGRTYEVRDYLGNIVSSGSIGDTDATVYPTAPSGGWPCGWYRYYLYGPDVGNTTYKTAYGAYTFIVIRDNPAFVPNASQATFDANGHGGESRDPYCKSSLGIGFSRLQIERAWDLTYGADTLAVCQADAAAMIDYWPADSKRPPQIICQFPNGTVDYGVCAELGSPGSSNNWLRVYPKIGVDGNRVKFACGAGSSSGSKLEIYYDDVLVETYDNLTATGSALSGPITTASSYVDVVNYGSSACETQSPQTIGSAYKDGVQAVVTDLVARGVKYFEGPKNEPRIAGLNFAADVAQQMKLFQAYVHEASDEAVAIGPCPIDIISLEAWQQFANADGLDYCDEISFHAYNFMTAGSVTLGRRNLEAFMDLLAANGAGDKQLWHTEATHTFCSEYGVYKPSNAPIAVLQTLLMEQYGIDRVRNHLWYDRSHGFWSYPSWWQMSDNSLNPEAALLHTLAEETLNMEFARRIDFASVPANNMFMGSVYESDSGSSVAVLIGQSHIPDATVNLRVFGTTDPLVVVDSWGNETSVSQSGGVVSVEVPGTPTYVRLPSGVSVAVHGVLDWGADLEATISPVAICRIGSVSVPSIGDTYWNTVRSSEIAPENVDLSFADTITFQRLVVWCAPPWQTSSALTDFDVQTSDDGSSWTTQATVTADDASSFEFATYFGNAGCARETYWSRQWIFPVDLGSGVSCKYVRIAANSTSYGGLPDADAAAAGSFGDGEQHVVLQEVAVLSSAVPSLWTDPYRDLVLAEDPIVYLKLDELSGTVAASEVNSPTTDGEYLNSPLLGERGATADGGFAVYTTPDQSPRPTIKIPHSALLNVGDTFSIAIWASPAQGIVNNYLLSKGTFGIRVHYASNVFQLRYGNFPIAQASVEDSDGELHFYVVTKDGSDTFIYRDGVDVTDNIDVYNYSDNSSDLYIAGHNTTDVFKGTVDEFALFDHVLTQEQAQDMFAAASTPTAICASSEDPVATGVAQAGRQIQCNEGEWNPPPTGFTYQWYSCDSDGESLVSVPGATRSDYIIDSGDVDKFLRCGVVALNVAGSSSASYSDVLGPVIAAPQRPSWLPPAVSLLSGVKSTTSDTSDDVRDVDKGWGIY